MANAGMTVTIGAKHSDGTYPVRAGGIGDVNGPAPDYSSVAADIATLVADGASPTQGHVNTLNSDWTTYKTAADAYTGKVGTLTADVTLYFNPATVTNMSQMRAALRELEQLCAGRISA